MQVGICKWLEVGLSQLVSLSGSNAIVHYSVS